MTSHLTGDFNDPVGLHGKGLGVAMGFVGLPKVREVKSWPHGQESHIQLALKWTCYFPELIRNSSGTSVKNQWKKGHNTVCSICKREA